MVIKNFFTSQTRCLIIAEIGVNHNGDMDLARKMIDSAKKSGADAVKFQIFDPRKYSSPKDKKRIAQLKKFSFKKKDIINLKKKSDELGIIFFATPFDVKSASLLNNIGKLLL